MLRTVRKVADAENGSVFLSMEFNGSAKSTEKAPLKLREMNIRSLHKVHNTRVTSKLHDMRNTLYTRIYSYTRFTLKTPHHKYP